MEEYLMRHDQVSCDSGCSNSSDGSMGYPPSFMLRKFIDQPPRMTYSGLEKELIELVKNDFPQIQQHLTRLRGILKTYEERSTDAATGLNHGKNSGIAGGIMMGLGIAFAPFTFGASAAVLCSAGAAVATGGVVGSGVWKSKKSSMEATCKQDFEAELKEFQNTIFQMRVKMKDINECIKEILRDINNPKHAVSYLGKYFASACELSRFIRIYDVGGLAAMIANLTEKITRITEQVKSTKEISDMRKIIIQLQSLINEFENIRIELTRQT